MSFRPLSFEFQHRKIVIIGGGEIALRRGHYFQGSGAEIFVYAPDIMDDMNVLTGQIHRCAYQADQLNNAFMVIAATNDPILNLMISAEARRRGALVNNVSDRNDCDFHFPAIAEIGDCTVAVSSGGENLAGAIELRNRIREIGND